MSDLLRTIFKWLIIIALIVLVILLIVGLAKGSSKNNKQPVKPIEQIKLEDETVKEDTPVEDTTNTLVIPVTNTASTEGITIWIGIGILGLTGYYVYKNKKSFEEKNFIE